MTPTPDTVAAASAAWIWIPDDAQTVETSSYLVVRYPDYFEHQLELVRLTPDSGGTREALEAALTAATRFGLGAVTAWARLDAPADLEDLLRARGGEPDETLDVLAASLRDGLPDLPAPEVAIRPMTDAATARDGHAVDAEVFGGSMPPEERLVAIAEETADDLATGRGGRFVAYVDGAPVGSGGLTLAGGVARLWGGGVREPYRGRGVYRALLRRRLEHAVEHGASMALVKGRVETSAPILRRAGFRAYGQERSYRVPLPEHPAPDRG